ncbi:MAG: hypothetical protein HOO96_27920 [Polyangiaceae bacterium]|nr:hypothetical protein [Polyangiaceae bacterium]
MGHGSKKGWCLCLLACIACKGSSQSGSAPAATSAARGEAPIPQLAVASGRARAPVPSAGARIAIARTDLRWGTEAKSIAPLPGADQWARGFDAQQKRNGQNDLSIVALSNAVRAAGAQEKDAHATVTVDAEVPYRIVVEVLFTLGQEGFHHFDFVVANPAPATFAVEVPVAPVAEEALAKLAADMERDLVHATGSATGRPSALPKPTMMPDASSRATTPSTVISRWTLRVSSVGVELRGPEAAACSVPRPDLAGIAACVTKIPSGSAVEPLLFSAPADLRFQELVSILDQVRGDDGQVGRFRTVHFALPR